MNPSTTSSTGRPDLQHGSDSIEAIPHRLGHQDAARPDTIDHFPGALAQAERAAKRAHLTGLDAEQAQAASGTVNLLHRYGGTGKDNVVLVPAPTADPQGEYLSLFRSTESLRSSNRSRLRLTDPFNLPLWRRIAVIVMLQICKHLSNQSAIIELF